MVQFEQGFLTFHNIMFVGCVIVSPYESIPGSSIQKKPYQQN